ncbi:hypothetical protein FOXYS1_14210 [Fusarium oxysporum]|uniref:RNase H type-1 domain-containing protein n=1 Tax=Fusarium oxysporum TaxID=5507 RepID=A0A8H4ZYT5_FUSOX|nr:hypothetical protein FOXYS1_14210 [Fusarium oxysporum]
MGIQFHRRNGALGRGKWHIFRPEEDRSIWLDSRLSFRVHVEKWVAKAQAVAYHLRGLTNTKHGHLPSAVRSAVRACVEPVLLYGASASDPGTTWPRWSQPSKDVLSSNQHLIQRMTKAMNQSMRAILPVWKTTPVAALHRESGIPPVDQLLEARRLRFPARLKSLDKAHPLAIRTLPPSPPVYHDLIKNRAAIYGFTIHQNNLPFFDGSGRLGPAEVFDAEATGALEGLKAALNLREAARQDIIICLDSLAAAKCLRGTPSDSSQGVFLDFQALAASHGATQVRWVLGHINIPGNEQADKLVKAASPLPEPDGAQPTLAYLRRITRQKTKETF